MVEAAVVPRVRTRPDDFLHGLDCPTAVHLFRDLLLSPDFNNPLTLDEHGPTSAMPLVALLLRRHEARLIQILVTGDGGRERLALALSLPSDYVSGYCDAWYGDKPTRALTDHYVLGYSQGADLRDLYLGPPR